MSEKAIKANKVGSLTRQRRTQIALRLALAVVAIAFALFPVVWIISASFNPSGSPASQQLIPANASFYNYNELLNDPVHPFGLWMLNSLKIATITAVLAALSTALSAYSFSRFRFRGRRQLLLGLLIVQVFPTLLMFVALFYLFQQLGSYIPFLALNRHAPVILAYLGTQMGIQTWLLKGFFDSIPRDIDESAMVDGATSWQIYWKLIFPLVRPMIVIVALLVFIGAYTEYVIAAVLLKDTAQITLMVGLYQMVTDQFAQEWGIFAAGGLIGALPIVILYQVLQDQIVGGLTAGSVKG